MVRIIKWQNVLTVFRHASVVEMVFCLWKENVGKSRVPLAFAQYNTISWPSFNFQPPATYSWPSVRVLLGKQCPNKPVSSTLYMCPRCIIFWNVFMYSSAAVWSDDFCWRDVVGFLSLCWILNLASQSLEKAHSSINFVLHTALQAFSVGMGSEIDIII